jgi:hypothetical protein
VKLQIAKKKIIPENWGRFHATWHEIQIDSTVQCNYPRIGKSIKPFQLLLDVKNCRGKYVGNMMHVALPYPTWWGEGDWLIWSDESGFPPGYHGTGTEEYYNSGWCWFDNKAIMRSIYGSTAFWYALPVQDANSQKTLLSPRLVQDLATDEFRWK